MKIRPLAVTLALSFATAFVGFAQTTETEPSATPAETETAEGATPDAQKKETDASAASAEVTPDAQKKEADKPAATSASAPKAAATKKAGNARMTPAAKTAAAPNIHVGTWKLNEAKSKMEPEMGKNSVVVYTMIGDKVKMTIDGVNKDGKKTHSVWVGRFDGKYYATKGSDAFDSMMFKVVNPRTNEMTAVKDKKLVTTGKITVAKDGKSRVVVLKGTKADGKKFKSKLVYTKE